MPDRPSSAPVTPAPEKSQPRPSALRHSSGAAIVVTHPTPTAAPSVATAPPVIAAAPPVIAAAPPVAASYTSEYSIFGGPDRFAPLLATVHSVAVSLGQLAAPTPERPAPDLCERVEAAATSRPLSPLLERYPRNLTNARPDYREYLLTQIKMRVIHLVNERQSWRAVSELSECLDAWGFASQNEIENLCICAAICDVREFLRAVLALS